MNTATRKKNPDHGAVYIKLYSKWIRCWLVVGFLLVVRFRGAELSKEVKVIVQD
jgi:hypothetical protein